MNDSSAAWERLRDGVPQSSIHAVPSIVTEVDTGYGKVRHALGPAGEPRLLIPCDLRTSGPAIDGTSNLKIEVARYTLGGVSKTFLDITCINRKLESVFSELCGEIMQRLGDGHPPHEAATGAIQDFRELLTGTGSPPSRSTLLGLLGELHVLRELARISPDAVECWMGPWERRHDFRAGKLALEVKVSGRTDQSRVAIHGSDQLLPPTDGELCLLQLRMDDSPGSEISLHSLYQEIVELTRHSNGKARLDEALARLGCLRADAPSWNEVSFALESIHAWRVLEGFPRLTNKEMLSGSFPVGVELVKYLVDLSAASEFSMSQKELSQFMEKMVNAQT